MTSDGWKEAIKRHKGMKGAMGCWKAWGWKGSSPPPQTLF
jgi:hypothetical protein